MNYKKKILIIGATGMLGNALMTELSKMRQFEVWGTVRNFNDALKFLPAKILPQIISNLDVENTDNLAKTLAKIKPDVVINCVGIIKQVKDGSDLYLNIALNALFPHRLAELCTLSGARLIHISTDCVFSGARGMYKDDEVSDAQDVYGKTKALGEVGAPHFTIRTSIIGHGLENQGALIDWFLAQKGKVKGFSKVIYSGFPTVETARIIAEYIIPHQRLVGIYNVSAEPISKYDLLKLVSKIYRKKIEIETDDKVVCDRSLDSSKFRKLTGFRPQSWEQLVKKMYKYYQTNKNFVRY